MQQQSVSVKERQQATGSDRVNTLYSMLSQIVLQIVLTGRTTTR